VRLEAHLLTIASTTRPSAGRMQVVAPRLFELRSRRYTRDNRLRIEKLYFAIQIHTLEHSKWPPQEMLIPPNRNHKVFRKCSNGVAYSESLYLQTTANVHRGTFGEVILVHSKTTKEAFAMKVITKASLKSKQDLNFLLREIKILKQIQHENILRLYQVFESEKKVYLQMEYCEGGELFYRIVNKGYLSEKEARVIITSLLGATLYLHEKQIVHRDIKPENILLSHSNNLDDLETLGKSLRLADFGLSNVKEDGVLLRTQCGSLAYTAPEVLQGKKVGYSYPADLWSIGVVAYVLLAGYFPFKTESESGMYDHIIKCKYNFNAEIWNHVSLEAKDFIGKLLLLKPDDRMTAKTALQHPWLTATALTFPQKPTAVVESAIPFPIATRGAAEPIGRAVAKPATFYPPRTHSRQVVDTMKTTFSPMFAEKHEQVCIFQ
jgi:serine/threonine protein kinase